MKASKTGLAILMFVLMAIVLMVAFGGKPYGQPSQAPGSGTDQSVALRKTTDGKPLSPASAAIVSSDSGLPKADAFQLSKSPYESANRPTVELPTVAEVPQLDQQGKNPFATEPDSRQKPDQVALPELPRSNPAPPRTESLTSGRIAAPRRAQTETRSSRTPPWKNRDDRSQLNPIMRPGLADNPAVRPGAPRQTPQPSHKPPKEFQRFHRIIDGDSLPTIAGRYLGDPNRYLEIFELNRKVLAQPDLLPLGARLEIPPQNRPAVGAADIRPITPGENTGQFRSGLQPGFGGYQPQSTTSPTPTPTHSPIPTAAPQQDEWRHVGGKNADK